MFIFLLGYSFLLQAQEPTYSFQFHQKKLGDILPELEQKTKMQIRYAPNWLDTLSISNTYEDNTLMEIISDLIKSSSLNAYKLDEKTVVLTRNNTLFNEVVESFFKEEPSLETFEELKELVPQFSRKSSDPKEVNAPPIKIGKQEVISNRYWHKIQGRVYNKETREAIAGVTLFDKKSNKYYISDIEGYYQMNLASGNSEIVISTAGYRTRIQPFVIFNEGVYDIELEEMVQALDEVVVQGNKINQVNSSAAGAENINVEETKTVPLVLGERDVLKIAASLPGISSAGEGASGLNVRGGRPDQNLNLLDGGVIYNPTHFFGIFQALNPIAISDVTIYKGSVPAVYGGRLSSVFDISSKNASLNKVKGEVSLGPITLNATIETPIVKDQSSLLIGARGAYSDWILKKLENEQLRDNKANFYDFIAKYYLQKNETTEFSLTTYVSHDQFNITHDSLFAYSNTLVSANLNKKLNAQKILKANASLTSYQHQIDYEGNANNGFLQSYRLNQFQTLVSVTNYAPLKHQITWGNSNTYYWIQPGMMEGKYDSDQTQKIQLNKAHALEGAFFISDQWDVTDKIQTNIALRLPYYLSLGPDTVYTYDDTLPKSTATILGSESIDNNKIESSYVGPEIRWSTRFRINDLSAIKLGVNNAYQFLHSLSNSTTAAPYDTWKLSDRHLLPQKMQQASLGYAYKSKNNSYDLTMDLYFRRYQNLTDFKTGAQLKMNEQIETEIIQGNGRSYGMELMLRKNEGALSGWISYSYARSFIQLNSEFLYERVNAGKYFPSNYDKPHDLSIVSNYKLSRRFSFSGNISYQTGRPVTYPTGKYQLEGITYITYSERNKYRIPNYFRVDVGFNIEGNHKVNKLAHGFWNLSIYNLLGKNNPYSIFFVNQDGKIKAYQSSIFARAIPSVSYTLKF